ncbi:hypothetical protein EIMP300_33410 [Escherichia coli]|uniref:Glycosyl transferase family 51 domain-containing protein n=1 Tax=Escherichia coli TaxID=562 RepID=A0A8S0FPZ6_ECOLX|nr:hypothetical protein EIMP300_33410 [Escherichia coli]
MPRLLTKRGCWIMLTAAPFIIILAAWAADKLWPLPLQEVNPARVVVAQDGTPLWRFADADGIWRYPVTIEDVSPRYLEALINYEDRWFWKHPGVNPFSVARAAWQLISRRVGSFPAAARSPCRWRACLILTPKRLAAKFVSSGARCNWNGICLNVKF